MKKRSVEKQRKREGQRMVTSGFGRSAWKKKTQKREGLPQSKRGQTTEGLL